MQPLIFPASREARGLLNDSPGIVHAGGEDSLVFQGIRLPPILGFLIGGACAVVVVGRMHVMAPLLAPLF
jgi:hypothetical protein